MCICDCVCVCLWLTEGLLPAYSEAGHARGGCAEPLGLVDLQGPPVPVPRMYTASYSHRTKQPFLVHLLLCHLCYTNTPIPYSPDALPINHFDQDLNVAMEMVSD